MAEFTPIMTQAEFDAAIADRLSQQKRNLTARYEGWLSREDAEAQKAGYEKTIEELNGQLKAAGEHQQESEKQLSELTARVRGYETDSVKTKIALEMGLPYQMAGRLTGDTEEAIRKDAELMRGYMRTSQPAYPLANQDSAPKDAQQAALIALAKQLGQ